MVITINTKLKIATTIVILYGVISMLYISCANTSRISKPQNVLVFKTTTEGEMFSITSEYQIIQVDSCQYIVGWAGDYQGGPYMTHKGNCPNNKHKQ